MVEGSLKAHWKGEYNEVYEIHIVGKEGLGDRISIFGHQGSKRRLLPYLGLKSTSDSGGRACWDCFTKMLQTNP